MTDQQPQHSSVTVGEKLSGNLRDVPLGVLLWTLEAGGRTGVLRLVGRDRHAKLFIERGRLMSQYDPEQAAVGLADLLSWTQGTYEVELGIRCAGPHAALPMSAIVPRAVRFLERAKRELAGLPNPSTLLVAFEEGASELDEQERSILAKFDGEHSLVSVLGSNPGREEATAAVLRSLWSKGALAEPSRAKDSEDATEEDLDAPPSDKGWKKLWNWMRGKPLDSTPRPAVSPQVAAIAIARAAQSGMHARSSITPTIRVTKNGNASWDRFRPSAEEGLLRGLELELEAAIDADEHALLGKLVASIRNDFEDAPPFPSAARAMLAALSDRSPSMSDTADVLANDESLARRVFHAANAPAFGRRTDDLEAAIARIGLHRVFRLAAHDVLAFADGVPSSLRAEALIVRRCSLLIADLCASLTEDSTRAEFYLAGLLHEVGTLEIYRQAPTGISAPRLRSLVDSYQASIGVRLARKWDLGEEVTSAIGRFPDASRNDVEMPQIVRCLRVSQIVSHGALFGSDLDAVGLAISNIGSEWDVGLLQQRAKESLGALTTAQSATASGFGSRRPTGFLE